MSVKDVIKSSVLKNLGSGGGLGIEEIIFALIIAVIIGVYIFFVYKNLCKSAFYSKDLNITMAGMTVVVAAIMLAMQSNLLVSLGMVGALSIVRFRTAIKNPLDLLYLFWAISAGIISGVGLYLLALVLSAVMTIMILGLGLVSSAKTPVVLIVKFSNCTDSTKIEMAIRETCKGLHLSSSLIRGDIAENIYEIKSKDKMKVVKSVSLVEGVISVSCLEHDGELRA